MTSQTIRKATIKRCPEDFFVAESLALDFSNEGEHAYFNVQKRGWNTADLAQKIALAYDVEPVAVGYAGRKDKHALTQQWFSVVTNQDKWLPDLQGVDCLDQRRHHKKLRLGDHQANKFNLLLVDVEGFSEQDLLVLQGGFPNTFGAQRFGHDNLAQAEGWIKKRRQRRVAKKKQGWHLSVLRSHLFNQVLAARCAAGNYATPILGDFVEDNSPTAPLWGRGRSQTAQDALLIEQVALQPYAEVCEQLEYAGVVQARRKLCECPRDLRVHAEAPDQIRVEFSLGVGAYATSMLTSMLVLEEFSKIGANTEKPVNGEGR